MSFEVVGATLLKAQSTVMFAASGNSVRTSTLNRGSQGEFAVLIAIEPLNLDGELSAAGTALHHRSWYRAVGCIKE